MAQKLTRKQQINILAAVALGVAILVMLIIAFAGRGTTEAYEQYNNARLRFLASKSGTVQMNVFVSTVTGPSSFYEDDKAYLEQRGGDITSHTLTTAQLGDRQYYDSAFYNGEQFYHSLGSGWFVHPPDYYADYYETDPFYDIGPVINQNYIVSAAKVDNSDTVVYTFTMESDTPAVVYPLHFFSAPTFIEQSVVVTLRAGRLDEIRRAGVLTLGEGAVTETFDVEITYRFFSLGEGKEVAGPSGL